MSIEDDAPVTGVLGKVQQDKFDELWDIIRRQLLKPPYPPGIIFALLPEYAGSQAELQLRSTMPITDVLHNDIYIILDPTTVNRKSFSYKFIMLYVRRSPGTSVPNNTKSYMSKNVYVH